MNRSAHDRDVAPKASNNFESLLGHAQTSFQARAWDDARVAFLAADALNPLSIDDLERLAQAASLAAHDELSLKTLERIHNACMEAGDQLRAVRAGFWLGFRLLPLGERARAQAWLSRMQRILDGIEGECAERGYLMLPAGILKSHAGELDGAEELGLKIKVIGERFGDRDLIAFSQILRGRVMLRRAEIEPGLSLFDDAMLAATAQELSPTVIGLVYCNVISGCTQVWALDRAREWTAALSEWCETQPQLRTFAGPCLLHRAELMELGGSWSESIEIARRAAERTLISNDPMTAASAVYQQAEIHRLRGETAEAEAAYVECSKRGREPQPGLSLLRLAQGKHDAAASAMRRVIGATMDRLERTRYLPAHVEVMLAIGACDEARAACTELESIATIYGGEVLSAIAQHAHASVLLAEGNAQAAVEPLRNALLTWQRIDAPYIVARIHLLLAHASELLGDEESAKLERGCARQTFEQLGAAPDLAALDAAAKSIAPPASPSTHGLSARELQVLRMVAAGKTNRAIASELFLSEKTVDRHVSNIFGKLDVPSRSAATAYAYEHQLL